MSFREWIREQGFHHGGHLILSMGLYGILGMVISLFGLPLCWIGRIALSFIFIWTVAMELGQNIMKSEEHPLTLRDVWDALGDFTSWMFLPFVLTFMVCAPYLRATTI